MRPPRLRDRWLAGLILLLHLLVVGAGPVADARLDAPAAEAHAGVHVESDDAPPCSSGHRHDHCLVCRTLQLPASPAQRAPSLLALHRAVIGPVDRGALPGASSARASPLGPRGPPAV